jgi:hypothetical protein
MPQYDGKTDWEGFQLQFLMVAQKFQWSLEEQCSRLVACMKGEALQYVARLPAHIASSWSSLRQALGKRFGDHMLPETYRASLLSLKKNPRETLREYEARMRQLMIKAYPGLEGEEFFETLAVEYLCNGLPDPNMAFDILVKKPKTIQQALDMIEWYECCRQTNKRRNMVRQVGFVTDSETSIDSPPAEVRRMGDNRRWVTEERLQQFGRDLQESLHKSLSESLTQTITQTLSQQQQEPARSSTTVTKTIQPTKSSAGVKESYGMKETWTSSRGSNHTNAVRNHDNSGRQEGCFRCGALGHFARSCPTSGTTHVRAIGLDQEYEEEEVTASPDECRCVEEDRVQSENSKGRFFRPGSDPLSTGQPRTTFNKFY